MKILNHEIFLCLYFFSFHVKKPFIVFFIEQCSMNIGSMNNGSMNIGY